MINARAVPSWFRSPKAKELQQWVADNSDAVEWDFQAGSTYLNGETFHTCIIFNDESVATICKLLFQDLIWIEDDQN